MAGAARQPEYRAGRSGFSLEFYAVHIAAEAAPTVFFLIFYGRGSGERQDK